MVSRIEPIAPGEAQDDEVNQFLREAADGWYEDAAFFGAMAHQPVLLRRLVAALRRFPESDALDAELLELMRLRVAAVHQCAYCGTVRTRAVREAVADKEDAVFGAEIDTDALTAREALAVRLADVMSRDPQALTDEFFEDLRAEFTDATIVELLLYAGIEVGLDRFCIALRLDTTPDSPYPTGLEYPLDRSGT